MADVTAGEVRWWVALELGGLVAGAMVAVGLTAMLLIDGGPVKAAGGGLLFAGVCTLLAVRAVRKGARFLGSSAGQLEEPTVGVGRQEGLDGELPDLQARLRWLRWARLGVYAGSGVLIAGLVLGAVLA